MPRIDLGGARIACTDSGSGETVLLLHATASSRAQWGVLAEALRTSWHVLAPDLYGYGETDPWPGNKPFALADEAALAEAVLPPGDDPIHLIGHSYGGAVALRFAMQWPERLLSLVLIEPVAFHLLWDEPPHPADRQLVHEVGEIAALVSRAVTNGDYRSAMARFVDYWNGDGAWSRTKPDLQSELVSRIPKVALDFRATTTELASRAAYGRIGAPTLVLRGSRSPRPTLRIAELVAHSLPRSRLQTIDGAGHMLPLTHAEAVNAAIVEHLLRRTPGRRHPAAA
jgi:pimeloyl-ACP methyl ester carboxylesterase